MEIIYDIRYFSLCQNPERGSYQQLTPDMLYLSQIRSYIFLCKPQNRKHN